MSVFRQSVKNLPCSLMGSLEFLVYHIRKSVRGEPDKLSCTSLVIWMYDNKSGCMTTN